MSQQSSSPMDNDCSLYNRWTDSSTVHWYANNDVLLATHRTQPNEDYNETLASETRI